MTIEYACELVWKVKFFYAAKTEPAMLNLQSKAKFAMHPIAYRNKNAKVSSGTKKYLPSKSIFSLQFLKLVECLIGEVFRRSKNQHMEPKTKKGAYLEINTNHNNHLTFSRFWSSKKVCLLDKSFDTRTHKQKEMRFQIQNRLLKKPLEIIFCKICDNTVNNENAHRKVMKR